MKKRFNILSFLAAAIVLVLALGGIIALCTGQGFGMVEEWETIPGAEDYGWLQEGALQMIFGTDGSIGDAQINGIPVLSIAFYALIGGGVLALLLLVLELVRFRGIITRLVSLVMIVAFAMSAITFFLAKTTIPSDMESQVDFINQAVTLGGGFMTAAVCSAGAGVVTLLPLALS